MIKNINDLLEYLSLEKDGFESLQLNKVSVNEHTGWFFDFKTDRVLSYTKYNLLVSELCNKFTHGDINVSINALPAGEEAMDYVYNVINKLVNQYPRFSFFEFVKVDYNRGVTFKTDEMLIDSVKASVSVIENKLRTLGIIVDIRCGLINEKEVFVDEVEKVTNVNFNKEITKRIEEEIKLEEPVAKKEDIKQEFNNRYQRKVDFRGIESTIKKIPKDQAELDAHVQEFGVPHFIIEGEIFDVETRDVKNNGRAYSVAVTDFTESIIVRFISFRDDQKNLYNELFKTGTWIKVSGEVAYDFYVKDIQMKATNVQAIEPKVNKVRRVDNSDEKRVELHLHTKMSTQDAVTEIKEYVDAAVRFGHKAIALTDHHGAYAIPDFYSATKGKDIKPIYGVEVTEMRKSDLKIAFTEEDINLKDATYVVFDIETTGFSVNFDEVIEIAAIKVRNGQEVERFDSFVKPNGIITEKITEITSITNEDVANAPSLEEVMAKFREFSKGCILVAHNASFDMSHIYENYRKLGFDDKYPVIDTLQLLRTVYADRIKKFNLKAMAKLFKVDLTQHHRAIYDTKATAECFIKMLNDLYEAGVDNYNKINYLITKDSYKNNFGFHFNILVKNQIGLKNLFKIISESHTVTFASEPVAFREFVNLNRDGLLIGSGCVNGRVFDTAMNKSHEQLIEEIKYFDYIEVQPPSVYGHLFDDHTEEVRTERVRTIIKKIIDTAKSLGKLVVATGDVHHLEKEEVLYRDILVKTPITGGGFHKLARVKNIPSQHFMTTVEMLGEFRFLDEYTAREIVITNTNLIADKIEKVVAIKDELFTPKDDFLKETGIDSIEVKLSDMCYERAYQLYGNPLPKFVSDRLEKELKSIITNGFAVIYYISHMLVKKSNDEGYLVGSRGSVGSSFVATLSGITEVNPLSPHYRCNSCQFSAFKMNEDEKNKYNVSDLEKSLHPILDKWDSGFDLPDHLCPKCGRPLRKDGHDIPFETFLGFKGDKVPDIDLNFSGEYQPKAHNYCKEVFGEDFAFRAGTISTIADKIAYGFVKKYFEGKGSKVSNPEAGRLAKKITGVKRTTGQHPGGIIIVPNYMDIYDITPVQYPSDELSAEWRTTHFDFHSIHDNLLKLDILGHDDPTVIKYLMDYVKENPTEFDFNDAADIPLDDKTVYELFKGTSVIGVSPEQLDSNIASFGIPEFGTKFVREMLEDTKPSTFAELVKISGLSHGTDVWLNNAKELVTGAMPQYGNVNFKDVIGCRDDIMVFLMYQGLEPQDAFTIMEFVRKGMPTKNPEKWNEYSELMKSKGVPQWYIWSCQQIKYMFPKAHATAYVLMAMRVAWFKVHKPIAYYSAYFSKRADQFDAFAMLEGAKGIRKRIAEITKSGNAATATEKSMVTVLEIALEFVLRGFKFSKIDIAKSDSTDFLIEGKDTLRLPLRALDGLGDNVAETVVAARKERMFTSLNDVKQRTKLNKTQLSKLEEMGSFNELGNVDETIVASKEVSLFDM